jgi:hypothetical protein
VADSEKRKISAREILADIRSGLDDSAIKTKHRLSEDALEAVYHKLAKAGLLTEAEIGERLAEVPKPPTPAHEEPSTAVWRCPACEAPQPSEVDECPVCGVIVAQYQAMKAREPHMSSPGVEQQSSGGRRIIVVCVLVALVLVGGAWLLWPESQPKKTKQVARTETRPAPKEKEREAPVPQTGELVELQFSAEGFPLGLSVSEGFGLHLFDTPSKDQGFKKLPPETDARRHYDEFKIAGQKFLVVTEESNPPKFYFDANKNGDLTDDPGPYVGERPGGVVPNNYTLKIPYKGEQDLVPYRMWIFPSRMGGTRFYPTCHWQGQLDVYGKAYTLVLFDGNADGDYSNDPAIVDIDGDGKASEAERLKPGQSVELGGAVVKLVSIAPSGRSVRIEFAEVGASETDTASE